MQSKRWQRSIEVFEAAKSIIPSGANSPGRLFSDVDTPSLIIDQAIGSVIRDVDGNEYIDFVMGLGPCILGHGNIVVSEALKKQVDAGTIFGMTSALEIQLAKRIISTDHHLEKLRFTCSGTEAVMSALRVARAHTGKSGILKFTGGYHGHADCALAKAAKSSIRKKNHVVSDGILVSDQQNTFVSRYNDANAARALVEENYGSLATIIVEPVATNMGLILPNVDFLTELRTLCDKYNIVLIFDEVVSGFRFCFGPVSKRLKVKPDLTTFGKIIGGGVSIGAYAGRDEIMSAVSQKGGVFQGGTFAGNPLAMAAGIATLDVLSENGFYDEIFAKTELFVELTKEYFKTNKIPFGIQHYGSLASYIFNPEIRSLRSFDDVEDQNTELFSRFHLEMVERGILFPPTIEEPIFFSFAHNQDQITLAAKTAADVLRKIIH